MLFMMDFDTCHGPLERTLAFFLLGPSIASLCRHAPAIGWRDSPSHSESVHPLPAELSPQLWILRQGRNRMWILHVRQLSSKLVAIIIVCLSNQLIKNNLNQSVLHMKIVILKKTLISLTTVLKTLWSTLFRVEV